MTNKEWLNSLNTRRTAIFLVNYLPNVGNEKEQDRVRIQDWLEKEFDKNDRTIRLFEEFVKMEEEIEDIINTEFGEL